MCPQWGSAQAVSQTYQHLLHHAAVESACDGVGQTKVQKVRGQCAGKIRRHDTTVMNVVIVFERCIYIIV